MVWKNSDLIIQKPRKGDPHNYRCISRVISYTTVTTLFVIEKGFNLNKIYLVQQ